MTGWAPSLWVDTVIEKSAVGSIESGREADDTIVHCMAWVVLLVVETCEVTKIGGPDVAAPILLSIACNSAGTVGKFYVIIATVVTGLEIVNIVAEYGPKAVA